MYISWYQFTYDSKMRVESYAQRPLFIKKEFKVERIEEKKFSFRYISYRSHVARFARQVFCNIMIKCQVKRLRISSSIKDVPDICFPNLQKKRQQSLEYW